jgi:hypothetical protein
MNLNIDAEELKKQMADLGQLLGKAALAAAQDYVKDPQNKKDLIGLSLDQVKAIFSASAKRALVEIYPLPDVPTPESILAREKILEQESAEILLITEAVAIDADRVARLKEKALEVARGLLWKAIGIGLGALIAV